MVSLAPERVFSLVVTNQRTGIVIIAIKLPRYPTLVCFLNFLHVFLVLTASSDSRKGLPGSKVSQ